MKLNTARVWLGGIAGGVVWSAWSFFIGMRQGPFYEAMQKQGFFLKESRYPFFAGQWVLLIFVMSILMAYLYAWSRATAGARTEDGAQDRDAGWILRGRAGQLRASRVVAGSARVAAGMDARHVGGIDSGYAGRGISVQGVS